ncbi:hypothetical protein TNCV_548051 [Trichonephila clavipes]|nr:hypothetical protein TNCV_548051 [Trichonephila clavipes]
MGPKWGCRCSRFSKAVNFCASGAWLRLPSNQTCSGIVETSGDLRLLSAMKRQCLQTTIFLQDGATPRIGRYVEALLSANFGNNHESPEISWMHGLLAHPT